MIRRNVNRAVLEQYSDEVPSAAARGRTYLAVLLDAFCNDLGDASSNFAMPFVFVRKTGDARRGAASTSSSARITAT